MDTRRTSIACVLFVVDLVVCAIWAYREASSILAVLSGAGSGSIGGIGASFIEALYAVVPPIATIWLARASGSNPPARYWRNAHLAVLLALVILPVVGGLRVMMVSIVVFLPVQVFFVVGALAIWIASPRTRPEAPREAAS